MGVHRKLRSALLNAGLTEPEATVYMELASGPAKTIWELVTRTGLSKSSTYRAFDRLRELKMVENGEQGIQALSLKSLVAELNTQERKLRKNVLDLKTVSPYLHCPKEPIEAFETLYTPDQIREAYLFMSQIEYDTNLDFGDYEKFTSLLGDIDISMLFRRNRMKHATHHAICTTFGRNTSHFCTKEAAKRYQNKVDLLDIDFHDQFIVFSDTNDYVLFNYFSDIENPYSVLVKSRAIANAERTRFAAFSRRLGND